MRAIAGAEETHAAHERSVGHTRGRENDLLAWREIVGVVNLVRIGYAHRLQALDDLRRGRHFVFIHAESIRIENQARLNLAVQTLDRRGGQHAFGRAPNTDTRVNICACYRRRNSGREIAVRDQTNARARGAGVIDYLFVSRAIQIDHGQVFDVATQTPRDVAQVVFDGRVDVDHPARRWPDDDLVHVNIRRVQQTATLGSRQHGDRIVRAERAQVRAFQRIDGNVHFGT